MVAFSMVSAVVDRGNGGPWEWRTPGMADPNRCTSLFLARKFLFVPSVTCCTMYRLATKRTAKKLVEENASASYFETQKTTRALVYSALLTVKNLRRWISPTLLVTLEWIVCMRS